MTMWTCTIWTTSIFDHSLVRPKERTFSRSFPRLMRSRVKFLLSWPAWPSLSGARSSSFHGRTVNSLIQRYPVDLVDLSDKVVEEWMEVFLHIVYVFRNTISPTECSPWNGWEPKICVLDSTASIHSWIARPVSLRLSSHPPHRQFKEHWDQPWRALWTLPWTRWTTLVRLQRVDWWALDPNQENLWSHGCPITKSFLEKKVC